MDSKAKKFIISDYLISEDGLDILFNYKIELFDGSFLDLSEKIVLPTYSERINNKVVVNVLKSLQIILGISYYKVYFPPEIEVPFRMSKSEADFWNAVYLNGLGEYMYTNNLSPVNIAKFVSSGDTTLTPENVKVPDRYLVGIGGGKDSILGAKLMLDFDFSTFFIATQKQSLAVKGISDILDRNHLEIKRFIDNKLIEGMPDSYNGHIPISAIYSFIGLLSCALYGYKAFVASNEFSSNFGNLSYLGMEINHQWSKSIEYERLVQNYVRDFISPDLTYFSVLRQFYEIRIAKMFAERCSDYFSIFSSCNKVTRIKNDNSNIRWCAKCAKCAFAFLIMAPHLDNTSLMDIFGSNFFEDSGMIPVFEELLGLRNIKPFDCVGTIDESIVAFYLSSLVYGQTIVFREIFNKLDFSGIDKLKDKVYSTNIADTLPTQFKFLGISTVCILGYGKEGFITENFLKKYYPELEIHILDEKRQLNYLDLQYNYDLAIKTPGIHKSKVNIPYTTATNIFFSRIKNKTIGITGSKGKSTTSSLIYSILKQGGFKVKLIGNIGVPMLSVLLDEDCDPEEIFVIELSSYMLDDIQYSPNIAVLINLFPEHMDYHGSVDEYYNAKRNIFKFQKEGDIFIEGPFDEYSSPRHLKTELIGAHNLRNISAAVKVAKLFNINDKDIELAIKGFQPLPHRLEFVGTINGIKFYDDAISTTPDSTICAIEALNDIGTIFLGGRDRGYDFKDLIRAIEDKNINNIVLFPDSGSKIKALLGPDFNILETVDMDEAVKFAIKNTFSGQICLLSTASPSYSIWKNFEEKGDLFKKAVLSNIMS